MKKARIRKAEICIGLAVLVTVCGCSNKETVYSNSKAPVSVYLSEYSSFINIIDRYNSQIDDQGKRIEYTLFPLEDSENMYKKMTNELLAGEGPDLLCFDSSSGVNVSRLAQQGAFLEDLKISDVSELISEHVEEGIIPVSYDIPLLITTEETCRRYGIDRDKTILTERDLDRFSKEGIPVLSDPYRILDVTYEDYVDRTKRESLFGESGFQTLLEVLDGWTAAETDPDVVYSGVNPEELNMVAKGDVLFSLVSTAGTPLNAVIYYNMVKRETGQEPILFGMWESGGEMKAYAKEIAAVNANSDNQQGAVEFIEYLLSSEVQNCTEAGLRNLSGIPVLDTALDAEITMMSTVPYKESYYEIEEGASKNFEEKYKKIIGEVKGMTIRDGLYKSSIFDPALKSYKLNQIDQASLIEELDKKTDLYLRE